MITEEIEEEWSTLIPKYIFAKRARLVNAFYGPEVELFNK
jgi:hypothetical protein